MSVVSKEGSLSSIPVFLLKKLYVRGSLRNTVSGFELAIQNTIAPGTIVALLPLKVDGVEYSLQQTQVVLSNGTILTTANVSAQSPVRFGVGEKVTIQVKGSTLPSGPHKLIISPKTKEAGTLQIPVDDTVQ
jgi:hypothetical protein